VAIAAYMPANPHAAGEMTQDRSVRLASLSAYDSNHDYLGKVKDDVTFFKAGEPVFIQANFTNPGGPAGDHYYLVVIEVRNDDTSETAALSSVKFAGQGSSLAVETYWKPDHKAGYYTVLVFLQKLEDLGKTPVLPPVASVRVQAA
ncbi:MAG: hypothetical protein ABI348_02395, partial [Nitrososphaera sp.]